MAEIPQWHVAGEWFDNCSCAVPCPCTFAQAPDNGFCESVLFWHVREGHYGDVKLDNLSFVRVGRWEGDLWAIKATVGPTSPPGKYPQLINAPGSETGPGPQLVTWGKSTILSVDAHGFKFEYTLNSAKHIPFDWVGP